MLLRGRWMYVLLGAVVVMLYARLLVGGSIQPLRSAEQLAEKPASSPGLWELELDSAKLIEASQQRPHLALLLGVWALLAAGLGLAGMVLSVWAVSTQKLRHLFLYRSHLPTTWSLGELARILLLLVFVASLLPFVHLGLIAWGILGPSDSPLWLVIAMFVLEGLLVLIVWGFATTRAAPLAAALGLSLRKGTRPIRQGLVGYVAIFPWLFGLLWLIGWISHQLGIEPPVEPIQELLFKEQQGLVVGLTVVLACVVGPIAEEIFFRGILFTALRRHTSRLVAMLMSGALFAAVHTNPIGFVPIVILGCLLADLYERTGSLLSPIAVHVLHNTLLVGLGLTLKALL